MTPGILALSATLCRQATLDGLKNVVTGELLRLIPADELVVDVSSFTLSRPALIRHGVDPGWAKRYNDELHRLNPATPMLRLLVEAGGPVVRRFADLVPGPLDETRFYQEYMRPQGHRHSLIAAMALAPAGGVVPAVILLLVRREGRPAFGDGEVESMQLLVPSLAWATHCAMRGSDDWTAAVLTHAFELTPKLAEVAVLVTKGMANKEIADALTLSVGTVKHYVHQILEATGAASRADLTRLVLS